MHKNKSKHSEMGPVKQNPIQSITKATKFIKAYKYTDK